MDLICKFLHFQAPELGHKPVEFFNLTRGVIGFQEQAVKRSGFNHARKGSAAQNAHAKGEEKSGIHQLLCKGLVFGKAVHNPRLHGLHLLPDAQHVVKSAYNVKDNRFLEQFSHLQLLNEGPLLMSEVRALHRIQANFTNGPNMG